MLNVAEGCAYLRYSRVLEGPRKRTTLAEGTRPGDYRRDRGEVSKKRSIATREKYRLEE